MADNTTTNSSGGELGQTPFTGQITGASVTQPVTDTAVDSAMPAWLKELELKNQQLENTEVVSPVNEASSALQQIKALKAHEEKAKLDENGNVVLDNVLSSPEKVVLVKEEAELAGLTFEGEDEQVVEKKTDNAVEKKDLEVVSLPNKLVEPEVLNKANSDVEEAPDWLKNLSNSADQKAAPKLSEERKEEIAGKKEAEVIAGTPDVLEKNIHESQAKGDLLQNLTKGLVKAMEKTKMEIDKGKAAGVEEANITLENFEASKAAKANVAKTPAAKSAESTAVQERQRLIEAEKIFQDGMATVRDLIAPSSMEVDYDHLRVEGMFSRTFIVYSYPRYLDTNWLSPIVNFDATMDITQFIYPIDSAKIMRILSKKVTQMQSAMHINAEKGLIRDPGLETSYEDAEQLRTEIQRGQEKFFQFAMYLTVFADDLKKIDRVSKQLESILGSKLILTKKADLRMEHGFNSTSPLCLDELEIVRNMNTGPLSTTFPFSSSDLTSNEGILYGLNRHNDSLVIFDRFSLPNANSVVFAISGAGKSYAVKLEILRYLMLGVDVIVVDPEREYEELTQTVGGSYLRVSLTSDRRINPFDLPAPLKDEELQPGDLLRSNIITLHGLLKLMLGGVTPAEEGIIDKALNDVYSLKGITMEINDPSAMPVPTMEDLHALLLNMEGATELAQRLEKYTKGTYSGIFNKPTNIDMKNGLMVFSIRDLEDALRPIAMYIVLNFIWNRVRSQLKKRLLIVDEAWTMMQYEDSARFLFGLVKRARKYYLGITNISQNVEDFMNSPYGKPIVTNSEMQLLLKQSPASISILQKTFNLTEGEKYMLLNSGIGQGLFFAGLKHVAIQIIGSYTEDKIVTTNPEEILRGMESGEGATSYE